MTIDSWPPIDSILTVGLCYDRELCALFLFGDPREGCTNMFCWRVRLSLNMRQLF